ncbi:MAG: hypothetical protein ACRCSY_03810 [Cetobacterium sp.]
MKFINDNIIPSQLATAKNPPIPTGEVNGIFTITGGTHPNFSIANHVITYSIG